MQEAYLEVWHKAHLYQPNRGKPLSWLMMICHRRAIDRVRWKASAAGSSWSPSAL
ncbi:sigma factor [Streptomyces durhamensis]